MSRDVDQIAADAARKIRVAYVDSKGPLLPEIIELFVKHAIVEGQVLTLKEQKDGTG